MDDPHPTRRALLRTLALSGAAVALLPTRVIARAMAPSMGPSIAPSILPSIAPSLRVGVLLGADARSARAGVELGGAEAARTAALLGGAVTLVAAPTDEAAREVAVAARGLVERDGVHALIGGDGDDAAAALGEVASTMGIPFINIGATGDALRVERCAPFTFHVEASDRMYADAITLAPDSGPTVVLWHHALERYGAAQLNDRFRARFKGGMDSAAWAGWFAVKSLWECAARGGGDAAGLARLLATGRFDGHKGKRLSFRSWDGQLRQPLYVLPRHAGQGDVSSTDAPSTDVPLMPVEVPTMERGIERVDTDSLLDRLGAPASASACPGGRL